MGITIVGLGPGNPDHLTRESWDLLAQDARAWAERVQKETKTKAVILKPGESYSF